MRKNDRTKTFVRVMALILVIAMLASSAFYLIYMIADEPSIGYVVYAADAKQLSRVDDMKALIEFIEQNYKDKVEASKLIDAAYNGIFKELDDKWSEFYTTTEAASAIPTQLENTNYGGVGVTISLGNNGECNVNAVNMNGPAKSAGIVKGDVITAIDGKSIKGWSLDDISNALRGTAGTQVVVTVLRAGKTADYTVTRAKVVVTSVDYEVLEGHIGYILLESFDENCERDFRKARLALLNSNVDSLIIDIRGNGGGYLDLADNIASSLLKPGQVVTSFMQQGKTLETVKASGSSMRSVPMVLLIDGESASASECLAAALKENGAATLVGENTYGKGVAQSIYSLNESDGFKLSRFYFMTPNGNYIDKVGVAPDYVAKKGLGYSEAEISKYKSEMTPMNEGKKYAVGESGQNVKAAQERLWFLGYNLEFTSVLDADTAAAIRDFQKKAGGYPYGGLDFFTMNALEKAFDEHLSGDHALEKAIELLTK